jgi:hypothetical protein
MSLFEVDVIASDHPRALTAFAKVAQRFYMTGSGVFALRSSSEAMNKDIPVNDWEHLPVNGEFEPLLDGLRRAGATFAELVANPGENRPTLRCTSQGAGRFRLLIHPEQRRPFDFYEAVRLGDIVRSEFTPSNDRLALIAALAPEQEAVVREREKAVEDLRAATARLGELVTVEYAKIPERAAAEEARTKQKIDAHEKSSEQRLADRQAELDGKQAALEERIKSVDDRSRTHKRRDEMKALLLEASERKTIKWRSVSAFDIVCVALLAVAAGGAYVFGKLDQASDTFKWNVVAPFTACALVFTSTLIFYLRWKSHQLAVDETRKENRERFALDARRAEWLAELVFEWKEDKNTGFPLELVSRFATDLFQPHGLEGKEFHPVGEVLSALTDVKRLKVQEGKKSVEFEREGTPTPRSSKATG